MDSGGVALNRRDDQPSSGGIEFRLLGPVEALNGGRLIRLVGRQQMLLAALLLRPGQVVSADELITVLWDGASPDQPRSALQTHISRLRAVLGDHQRLVIGSTADGYLVRPADLDLTRFRDLVGRAGRTAEPLAQVALVEQALQLWRGEPLTGLPDGPLIREARRRLHEERLHAVELLLDARLNSGQQLEIVSELTTLVERYPTRERLWALLMRAQYRADRRGDALATYERAARWLKEELGLDPGQDLRQAQADILGSETPRTEALGAPVPRQLPAPVSTFVGRTQALDQLDAFRGPVVVSGTAGIGKTTLVVQWAHRASGAFPDGQLYLDLRGFGPSERALPPADALRSLLEGLGVRPDRMPKSVDDRAAMYRSLVAGRQILVVLDNASDAEQVRPLLPGSGGRVVITSRNRLGSLVVSGAESVVLDRMTTRQAKDLLAGRLGTDRLARWPAATDELVRLGDGLPLALALLAARVALVTDWPLETLVADLEQSYGPLDRFSSGDGEDLRIVFSWSYHALEPDAARLFRLLALHPGALLSPASVSSLAGWSVMTSRPVLDRLARSHLISERAPGHYVIHDLLREYAAECAAAELSEQEHREAVVRLLDHYLHTAHEAARQLFPHRDPIALPDPAPRAALLNFTNADQAWEWFLAERSNLIAIVQHAHGAGFRLHTARLVPALSSFLGRRGEWHAWIGLLHLALDAAQQNADLTGMEFAHRFLANAYIRVEDLAASRMHIERCFEVHRRLDDQIALARAHRVMGLVHETEGRPEAALDSAIEALHLFSDSGLDTAIAEAQNAVGFYCAALGRNREALTHCQRALVLLQKHGHRRGEADTWDSLGHIHEQLGYPQAAREAFEMSLRLYRDVGDRYFEATAHRSLGDLAATTDDPSGARRHRTAALEILTELDHPDAAAVRTDLGQP